MGQGEWYGLDELGRGFARPVEAAPSKRRAARRAAQTVAVAESGAAAGPAAVGESGDVADQPTAREPAAVPEKPAKVPAEPSAWEASLKEAGEKLDQLLLAARALGDSMSAHAVTEDGRAASLGEVAKRLDALSEQFKARIEKTDYENAMLKRLSDELDEHRGGLYRKIVEPLIGEVIDVHRDMTATVARHRRAAEDGTLGTAALLRDLEEYRLMLGDILGNWSVEVWEPAPGETVEPRRCRAVGACPTDDKVKHRTVAETVTAGYAFDGKILRPACVVAFAYKPASEARPQQETDPAAGPSEGEKPVGAEGASAQAGGPASQAASSAGPQVMEPAVGEPATGASKESRAKALAAAVPAHPAGTRPPVPPAPPAPSAKAGDRAKAS